MLSEIQISIDEFSSFFDPLNKNRISNEIVEYIHREMKLIPMKSRIVIKICGRASFSSKEKEQMIDVLRNHYGLLVQHELRLHRYRKVKKFVLLLIGILFIAFSSYLSDLVTDVIGELFLIAGWVVIWELVYEVVFTDNTQKFQVLQMKKLTNCQIIFEKEKVSR